MVKSLCAPFPRGSRGPAWQRAMRDQWDPSLESKGRVNITLKGELRRRVGFTESKICWFW